jgi:hypothetical protein
VFLPGITDTSTLDAASKLCGQAAYTEHGQDHHSRHDVATPDMVRQLPPGFALVIRGGTAPVIARLPRAWKDRAYRRARRRGLATADIRPAQAAGLPTVLARHVTPVLPEQMPPDPFPPGTTFPWN